MRDENVAPGPSCPPCVGGKGFSLFDNFWNEEMFRYHEKIQYFVGFCVIEKEKIWIAVAFKALDHGIVCTVYDFLSENES